MKITLQLTALRDALALCKPAIPARSPKPILSGVSVRAEDGQVAIRATDLELFVCATITAVQIDEPGACVLPYDRLLSIASSTSDASLVIETNADFRATITASSRKYELPGFDPAEYPMAPPEEKLAGMTFDESVADALGRASQCAAKAHSHYAMSGCLLAPTGGKLTIVATDGHMLGRIVTGAAFVGPPTIMPVRMAGIIARLAKIDGDKTLYLGDRIMASALGASVSCPSIAGNFPKHEDVIPKECKTSATANRASLLDAVRAVAPFSSEGSRGVSVTFVGEVATVKASDADRGRGEAACPVETHGDWTFSANPEFLARALSGMTSDSVKIEQAATLKPLKFTGADGEVYVVMPTEPIN